jgi:hypothetical protein
MLLAPGLKLKAHVELFKRDEATGEQILVRTSRPCAGCGQPLEDGQPVVPVGNDRQAHAHCVN